MARGNKTIRRNQDDNNLQKIPDAAADIEEDPLSTSQRPPSRSEKDERLNEFTKRLEPNRDLEQNWRINVSELLQQYLELLDEIPIEWVDGHSTMNFAGAAMLLQNSAIVYGRKVDLTVYVSKMQHRTFFTEIFFEFFEKSNSKKQKLYKSFFFLS